jgi:hypothetical protein
LGTHAQGGTTGKPLAFALDTSKVVDALNVNAPETGKDHIIQKKPRNTIQEGASKIIGRRKGVNVNDLLIASQKISAKDVKPKKPQEPPLRKPALRFAGLFILNEE